MHSVIPVRAFTLLCVLSLALCAAFGQAGSPWPTYQGNPQHTGRSPYRGPAQPNLLWISQVDSGESVDRTPVIGADGTIYSLSNPGRLVAYTPTGARKWATPFSMGTTSAGAPTIGADGTIYLLTSDGKLYAVNPDGTAKWAAPFVTGGRIFGTSPTIGTDGTIYLGTRTADEHGQLFAVKADGTAKWAQPFTTEIFGAFDRCSPTLGLDDTIYMSSIPYVANPVHKLYAVKPDGTVKWTFSMGGMLSSPTVGTDGTIYFGGGTSLYARNATGTAKWAQPFALGAKFGTSPALGADGTIYIGAGTKLYAIDPSGTSARWEFATYLNFDSTPLVDADGVIYITSGGLFHAVNPDGRAKWTTPARVGGPGPLSLGADGTLYIGSQGGSLFAVTGMNALETPILTPDSQNFTGSVTVSMTCATSDAIIYYTTNGSEPRTDNGTRYNPAQPVIITRTTTVKAKAFKSGLMPASLVATGIYTTDSPPVTGGRGDYWMIQHDPQHSGRSSFVGPAQPTLKWATQVDMGYPSETAPVIAADGSIYAISFMGSLVAFTPAGVKKWPVRFSIGDTTATTPAIGTDGTVYVGTDDGRLFAVSPDGTAKWAQPYDVDVDPTETVLVRSSGIFNRSSPLIAPDGTIYIGARSHDEHGLLVAVKPDGTAKWTQPFKTDDHGACDRFSPALAADGTIYIGSGAYNQAPAAQKLYAVNPDGTLQWAFSAGNGTGPSSSASVAPDGTIYVAFGNKLYAITPAGAAKWAQPIVLGGASLSTPALGADGMIYLGASDGKLYAVQPTGVVKWTFATDSAISASALIDAAGTIYIGTATQLYAVTADGAAKWAQPFSIGSTRCISPSLVADGTLYLYANGKLNAIGDRNASQPDLQLRRQDDADFVGDNVYANLAQQTATAPAVLGQTVRFAVKVENDSLIADRIYLSASGLPSVDQATVGFLDPDGLDITSAVQNGTWATPTLPAGGSITCQLEVTVQSGLTVGASVELRVTATSEADGTKSDAVGIRVTRLPTPLVLKPDLLLRPLDEPAFFGDNIYTDSDAGQTLTRTLYTGQTTAFIVRVQQDGNTPGAIRLALPPTPTGWTLRATDLRTGTVLAQTSTGILWTTPTLAPGATADVQLELTPASTLADGTECWLILAAGAATDPNKRDVLGVRVTTHRPAQPDLLIKPRAVTSYTGGGQLAPTSQWTLQEVAAGGCAIYHVKAQGMGLQATAFRLSALVLPAGSATVRVFDALTDGNDISTAILGTGWSTPTLAPGTATELRLEVTPNAALASGTTTTVRVTASYPTQSTWRDVVEAVTKKAAFSQLTLRAAPAGPVLVGTPVSLTAAATGGTRLEYEFKAGRLSGTSTVWEVIHPYAESTTATWTPGALGAYTLQVTAREVAQPSVKRTTTVPLTVHAPLRSARLTVAPAKVVQGSAVTLTAEIEASVPVEVQFREGTKSGTVWSWRIVRAYEPGRVFTYTPEGSGARTAALWVRPVGSTRPYELFTTAALTLIPAPLADITLTATRGATGYALSARTSDLRPAQYRFRTAVLVNGAWVWTTRQEYSAASACTWTPPAPGSYLVAVYARVQGSTSTYDVYATKRVVW